MYGTTFQVDMATRTSQCSVIVHGLFCGRPISCEVPFDISTLVRGEWVGPCGEEDVWEETIHQIAAKRLLQDFDALARRLGHENSKIFILKCWFQLKGKMDTCKQILG